MKREMVCLLLLTTCACRPSYEPPIWEFALTWTCVSAEGCERAAEVARIDRMAEMSGGACHVTSTQDASFGEDAQLISSDTLPSGCLWLYFLSLFGHELDRARLCFIPSGFELELSIPNQDPATSSLWLVEGLDVGLL